MATHSSVLAWRIPQTQKPGGYSPQDGKKFHELTREQVMKRYSLSHVVFAFSSHRNLETGKLMASGKLGDSVQEDGWAWIQRRKRTFILNKRSFMQQFIGSVTDFYLNMSQNKNRWIRVLLRDRGKVRRMWQGKSPSFLDGNCKFEAVMQRMGKRLRCLILPQSRSSLRF